MGDLREELEELRGVIEGVIERVDDLVIAQLREAIAAGAQRRPVIERRLTRARNALTRVLPLFETGGESAADPAES